MAEALHSFWTTVFYAPLFNALIWLYNGPAQQNFGWAIILLTAGLRVVLLPLSILSERNKHIYAHVEKQIQEIERAFKNDAEEMKERIRELLRNHRVSPWARTSSLLIQALVLVVLYQVFMGGIRMNHFEVLYPSVPAPDFVFTVFMGTDLGKRSLLWAAIVGIWLFTEITLEQRRHDKDTITKADQFYRVAFPLFSFGALYILPSAKSIFILTSMAISLIIASLGKMFVRDKA
jgi:YidC/Oxa1 family membrane protein insertase